MTMDLSSPDLQGQPTVTRMLLQTPYSVDTATCHTAATCSGAGWCGTTMLATLTPAFAAVDRDPPDASQGLSIEDLVFFYAGYLAPDTSAVSSCSAALWLDGYEYPLQQTLDFYGQALVARVPATVAGCHRADGQAITSSGSTVLAIGLQVIALSMARRPAIQWIGRPGGIVVTVDSIDGNVLCSGGVAAPHPDRIFADSFG